jgi:hypothetical protein
MAQGGEKAIKAALFANGAIAARLLQFEKGEKPIVVETTGFFAV